jgi:hypothetical protein
LRIRECAATAEVADECDLARLHSELAPIVDTALPGDVSDTAGFVKFVHRALEDFGRKKVTHRAWRSFEDSLSFVPSASSDLMAVASEVSKVVALTGSPRTDPPSSSRLGVNQRQRLESNFATPPNPGHVRVSKHPRPDHHR